MVALAPHAVAEPRRIIDAGRQKSGQHALRLSHGALAGQQFLDQVGNPFHIASPDRMIAPGHLDQPRIRDLRGQEAAGVGIDRIVAAMDQQRRSADRRHYAAYVYPGIHARQGGGRRRACRTAARSDPAMLLSALRAQRLPQPGLCHRLGVHRLPHLRQYA
ncbi:hypothetical protein [Mesorhizobium sp.]|uniref:hypothetical protein n=1 Tax=Mesorhizobium sp. TaxID=1871066 RepID=UPI00257BEA9C|nr:hypothetical protein [Mesorhizobium sp.]